MNSVGGADQAIDGRTFEPELSSSTPRIVKPRMRARVGRWMFAILSVAVPFVLCLVASTSQATLVSLLDHGEQTTGRVVEKRPPHDKSSPQLVYEYQVGGASFRIAESRERDVWAATPVGAQTSITYLPEDPGSAYSEYQLSTAGRTSPTAIAAWIVAGILAAICLPFWGYLEWKYGRIRHLAQNGEPTTGIVTSIARFGPTTHDQWCVKYQFAAPSGETINGTTYVYGSEVKKIEDNRAATVLFDPSDIRRYELYVAVAMLYTIVVDEFTLLRQQRT